MSTLKRILIVEDDAMLRLFLIDELAEQGMQVVAASSTHTASRLLDASIDALITDIELGIGPNGLTLARLAAQHHPHLPIVVVSGGVTPTPAQLPKGAIFVPKPYTVEALLAAIEKQRVTRAA